MKFLCIPCNTPMTLRATEENEPGSLSVVYSCGECGYEMAMLTNSQETQMVRSLGVRIGPAAAASIASAASATSASATGAGSTSDVVGTAKCPFAAMLGGPAADDAKPGTAAGGPEWTAAALARLDAIPEMVRPMARAGIEMVAREGGHTVIDEAILADARARFGM